VGNFFLYLKGILVSAEKVSLRAVLGGLGSPSSHISALVITPIALRWCLTTVSVFYIMCRAGEGNSIWDNRGILSGLYLYLAIRISL
jgi:hypothetical protein